MVSYSKVSVGFVLAFCAIATASERAKRKLAERMLKITRDNKRAAQAYDNERIKALQIQLKQLRSEYQLLHADYEALKARVNWPKTNVKMPWTRPKVALD